MPHEYDKTISQDERALAIHVARWLIVALPQELADALDKYAASLGPEATPAEAARLVLQEVLLGRRPPHAPTALPTGDRPPTRPTIPLPSV